MNRQTPVNTLSSQTSFRGGKNVHFFSITGKCKFFGDFYDIGDHAKISTITTSKYQGVPRDATVKEECFVFPTCYIPQERVVI